MAASDDQLDLLFRALSDATRRALIELLRTRPGLTTAELASATRGMTRWGVMKHLDVLDAAGLIQTFPEGRRRRHYLEPAALDPVRRWLG